MRAERFRKVPTRRPPKAMARALEFTQGEMEMHWAIWSRATITITIRNFSCCVGKKIEGESGSWKASSEAVTVLWVKVDYGPHQMVATEVERHSWSVCVFIEFIILNRFL